MTVAIPTASGAVAAIVAELDAIAVPVALDDVFGFEQPFPSEWEHLKQFQVTAVGPTRGDLQVVYVIKEGEDALEGRATGEKYGIFRIVSRLFFIRVNKVDWKTRGDAVAASIVAKLDGSAAVFRIGGQTQLQTPETAEIREQGFTEILDEHGISHKIYRANILTRVEGRRFT